MSMVCPKCEKSFEQRLSCPDCKVRLLYHASAFRKENAPTEPADNGQWQQTPWGRMAIGLLLAQGLGYGMQQLLTAGILVSGEETNVWATLWGMVLLYSIQGLGVIIGGAISGAGQRRGILYGSFVGLLNGLIYLFVQKQLGELTVTTVYFQPMLHMVFGSLGGMIGSTIWRPIPVVQGVNIEMPASRQIPRPMGYEWLRGRVYLGRIFAGIFIVVVGVVWSNVILEWVLHASEGRLTLKSHLQAELVGWEVAGLAILFGAGFAGACTFNGLKHGVCVGIGSSVVFIGIQMGSSHSAVDSTIFMIASMLILTVVGGWFGGQLFPPIQQGKRRRRALV